MKKYAAPLTMALSMSLCGTPVMAKSTIGGIVFVNTYTDSEKENLTLANAGNSRLRIKWTNEDSVSMYYEFAIKQSGNNVRHAYGKWDFSETGQLLAGETSTPFAPLNPNVAMVNNSGDGYGNTNPKRPAQLRYTYKFLNRKGAWAIAVVNPNRGTTGNGADNTNLETYLPRVDFGLAYSSFNWQIFPGFFYQKQKFNDGVDSLTSSGVSLGIKTGRGPFTLTGEVGAGQNWGNTSMAVKGSTDSVAGQQSRAVYIGNNKEKDVDNIAYWLDAGYRFAFKEVRGTAHLVYGNMNSDAGSVVDADSSMIGVSVPIDLPFIARGFRLRPEVFYFKDEDNIADSDTSRTIVGVQTQFTF